MSEGAGVISAQQTGIRERWRMGVEARALLLVTACLLAFGLAVLYSASALAVSKGVPYESYFFTRQIMGALVGFAFFAVAAKMNVEFWRKLAWPLMIASILMMLLIVLPWTHSIAPVVGGSRRFLRGGSVQPSEFAKLAVVIWTAMLLVKKGDAVKRLGKGLVPFLLVIGGLSELAMLEPDLSVAATFCLLSALLLFVAGARVSHFILLGALALPLVIQQGWQRPYVRERMRSFFAKESNQQTLNDPSAAVSDQQRQALIAIGSGRILGVGFGEGNQQRGWTPLAYNDFIASVIGEEFGFVGITAVTLAFALYGWLGFRIARKARSPFAALLAVGLTFTTVFTAFVHIGVCIDLLPNTGLTLPFISGGRSNLVLTLLMTGMLINIGSEKERVYGAAATDPMAPLPA
ncbi:MAG: putative peptidoglycan glycosyltransferase FtsW [Gemmatimonadaceae bacterium]